MDTTETAVITMVSSAVSAILSSFATSRKMRNEGDVLVSNALGTRTQQLFDNLSKLVDEQRKEMDSMRDEHRKEIDSMKVSLNECHAQHALSMGQYNETLKTLEIQRKRIETLENALGTPL